MVSVALQSPSTSFKHRQLANQRRDVSALYHFFDRWYNESEKLGRWMDD